MIDGLQVAASFNGGGVSTFIYDVANADEMQVSVSGASGRSGERRAPGQPRAADRAATGSRVAPSTAARATGPSGDNLND